MGRRIDVAVKTVYWSESGSSVAIVSDEAVYLLSFQQDVVDAVFPRKDPTMRLQLALNVSDLDAAVEFSVHHDERDRFVFACERRAGGVRPGRAGSARHSHAMADVADGWSWPYGRSGPPFSVQSQRSRPIRPETLSR